MQNPLLKDIYVSSLLKLDIYLKPKVTLQFLSLNISIPVSIWQEQLILIPMISKETYQTIPYGISIESTVKFTKSGFSVKAPLLFKFKELLLNWKNNLTTCLTDLVL